MSQDQIPEVACQQCGAEVAAYSATDGGWLCARGHRMDAPPEPAPATSIEQALRDLAAAGGVPLSESVRDMVTALGFDVVLVKIPEVPAKFRSFVTDRPQPRRALLVVDDLYAPSELTPEQREAVVAWMTAEPVRSVVGRAVQLSYRASDLAAAPALVAHELPSPFPGYFKGGSVILNERCVCGCTRDDHRDTATYGHGACARCGSAVCHAFTFRERVTQAREESPSCSDAR